MNGNNKKNLSIIIPVYNSQVYLEKCINSVIKQTYTDWELILIDDGSTDGSEKICDSYSKKDERITVIHQVNKGLSEARMAGLDIANGEWISFIDNDDAISPKMFELLLNLVKKNDRIEIAGGKGINISEKEIDSYVWDMPKNSNYNLMDGRTACSYMDELDEHNITFSLWGKVYKREIFKRVNLNEYKTKCPTIFLEDVLLTPILLHNSNKTAFTSEVVYLHRERANSISRSGKFSSFYAEQAYSSEILCRFYKENGYMDLYNRQIELMYKALLRSYYFIRVHKRFKEQYKDGRILDDIGKTFVKYYKDLLECYGISTFTKKFIKLFKISPIFWGMSVGWIYYDFISPVRVYLFMRKYN